MTTPITLVVFGFPGINTHLSDTGSGSTWCGLTYTPNSAVSFAFEPGSDFGTSEHDCPKCRAEHENHGGLP